MRDSHVNVGWKHSDQQKRQSISRRPPESPQKQSRTSQKFSRTANEEKRPRPRQRWWNNSHIWLRAKEVQEPADHKNTRKDDQPCRESAPATALHSCHFSHPKCLPYM